MDPITIALIAIICLFVAILSGMHISFALALISFIGLIALTGSTDAALRLLGSTAFEAVRDYVYAVVPLFILMGAFMSNSRAARSLYSAAQLLLRKVVGGLAVATVMANTVFAAVTGVSVASAAVFSRIALPEMVRYGYQQRFALGSVAGSSVLGMLIPPSLLLILYGILTQVSIGALFLAGVVPGLLLALFFAVGIVVMATLRPSLVGGTGTPVETVPGGGEAAVDKEVEGLQEAENTTEKASSLKVFLAAVPILVLVVIVLGGIWGGVFTPTEAAAIGAIGALIIGALMGMGWQGLWSSFLQTAQTTGSIMFLLIAAQTYSRMLSSSGFVSWLEATILPLLVSPLVILFVFVAVLVLLGAVLDSSSILLLTVPIMVPVVTSAGIDPLWFGVIVIVAVEIGLITPPFGMVPFAMSAVLGEQAKAEDIFIGAFPYVIMMLIFLAVLIAFPGISTWLPNLLL